MGRRVKAAGREVMEAQVIRTYLETISELPWNERSVESLSTPEAARILEQDHYALGDVKDRVLEFLAVRQLRQAAIEARKAEKQAAADETGNGTEAAGEAEGGESGGGHGSVPEATPGGDPSDAAVHTPTRAAAPASPETAAGEHGAATAATPAKVSAGTGGADGKGGADPRDFGHLPHGPPRNPDHKDAHGPILLLVASPRRRQPPAAQPL